MKYPNTTAVYGLLMGLISLVAGCGGGQGSADQRTQSPSLASSSAFAGDDSASTHRAPAAAHAAQAGEEDNPPDFTVSQLAGCPRYAFAVPVNQLRHDAPCLVGQYTGQVVTRNEFGRLVDYSRAAANQAPQTCSVALRGDHTAVVRMGQTQATYDLGAASPSGDLSVATTYQMRSFLERSITGQRIHLDTERDGPPHPDGGFWPETLHFSATRFDEGVPGWQLTTWFKHVNFGGEPSIQTHGCVTVLDEPGTVAQWATTVTAAQLQTCPDTLSPVSLATLPCLAGGIKGLAVDTRHQLLAPRQSCVVTIRPDGMIWSRIGGVLSAHRHESHNVQSYFTPYGSSLSILRRDAGGIVQRFMSGSDSGQARPEDVQTFVMDIHRPYYGAPFTLDIDMNTALGARCVASSVH